jgi:uncharacterized protein
MSADCAVGFVIHYRGGGSRISAEEYAVALVDEIDHPRHIRQRFTVTY